MRLLIITFVCAVSSLSLAQDQPESTAPHTNPWNARFAIEAHVGAFGPVGGLGASLEYTPTEYLALTLGAGATIAGWRAGAGLRGVWPVLPRMALGLEAWYSLGPHKAPINGFGNRGTVSTWDMSHVVRVGLSLEYRSFGGFRFRPFIGAAIHAAESGFSCSGVPCDVAALNQRVVAYLGLAVGYAAVR